MDDPAWSVRAGIVRERTWAAMGAVPQNGDRVLGWHGRAGRFHSPDRRWCSIGSVLDCLAPRWAHLL